jgi:hypothetical protein
VTEEALEKKWPDFRAMAFFYLERTDKEIFDLPHTDKIATVHRIHEKEFLAPIRPVLAACYGMQKANHMLEVELWN